MYVCQQLLLGLEPEPADEAIEELLARVGEVDSPYYGFDGYHGYHVCIDGMDDAEPVAVESDDDQA